ncbi:thioredoxin [Serendipita vermifera]|nr:thioredoxin [Serendipita vermifera]
MTVTAVTSLAQFKEIIAKDEVSVFDFWATWCRPCLAISPIFEQHSGNFPNVKFYKVDVDAVGDVAQEVGITAMPTFISFKSGQKLETILGAAPAKLKQLIETASASASA